MHMTNGERVENGPAGKLEGACVCLVLVYLLEGFQLNYPSAHIFFAGGETVGVLQMFALVFVTGSTRFMLGSMSEGARFLR